MRGGNFPADRADYLVVDCEGCREALSARLDGESAGAEPAQVEAHLAGCADCRSWETAAATVTRQLRVRPSADVPDLVPEIRAAAPLPTSGARLRGRLGGRGARVALAMIGCVQSMLGAVQMFGVHLGMGAMSAGHAMGAGPDMTGHLFNESAAWNFALGLALLWAAWRPGAVAGLLPMVLAFVVGLSFFVASDLAQGAVTPARASTHTVLLAALAVLLWMRRDGHLDDAPSPNRLPVGDPEWPAASRSPTDRPATRSAIQRGRHLRPAGRRAA